ncbi:hypothetical protein IAG44_03985 [Streptomyces roseirectus]|uniref:DinB-like domain-containing protein n=1 Tax=Streptomyces roseirectus TaxID=2768066 RepID=A0A7H0I7D7_9ACTN|nr:DinB family protein [Streptomyces roseirectus]QNP68703.1 hypothetical protein IAG44_03985 [Streptomyces roseirectus]
MNVIAHTSQNRPPRTPPACPRCAFDPATCDRHTAPDLLRDTTTDWQHVLAGPDVTRSCAGTPAWTVLEHGCHVRDMCLLFRRQLDTMLGEPRNIAPSSEVTNSPTRYCDEDARQVAGELGRAATALADRLTALTADDWEREDPRLPDLRLTLGVLTRHLLHDIRHSLHDARRGIRAPDARTATATAHPQNNEDGHG